MLLIRDHTDFYKTDWLLLYYIMFTFYAQAYNPLLFINIGIDVISNNTLYIYRLHTVIDKIYTAFDRILFIFIQYRTSIKK